MQNTKIQSPIQPLVKPDFSVKPSQQSQSASFGETLQGFIERVNRLQLEADDNINDLATGKQTDIHQTMIAVDCLGEIRGDLAVTWKKGDGGRRWTFELRPEARFWNGDPVTAWDVEWWWQSVMSQSPLIESVIDSIAVVDERILDVYFAQSYRRVPSVLTRRSKARCRRGWAAPCAGRRSGIATCRIG